MLALLQVNEIARTAQSPATERARSDLETGRTAEVACVGDRGCHSCFSAHIPPIPASVPPGVSRRPVSAHLPLPVCDKKIKGLCARSL